MSDNVIEVQNLTKRYGQTTVVKGISFSVFSGEQSAHEKDDAVAAFRDAVPIMRAVKARFDPRGTLNPGREPWEPGPS